MNRLIATCQFVAAAALVLSFRFASNQAPALAVTALGVVLGLSAIVAIGPTKVAILPDVKPETQLVTTGPYRLIRHPMYTALGMFCCGFVFTPFRWWKVGVWIVLLIVLLAKSRIEERQLMERFSDYADYAKRSWRFVPFVW